MTQATEPNDREQSLDRQLRVFDRRLKRLEDQMNARFNRLENSVAELRSEINEKFDAIKQCLTGFNNT
jgi:flagellar capping protein FliD